MGGTMRAAVLVGPKEGLQVRDVPVPEVRDGEVLVRIAACGICRTDLHYLHGTPTFKPPPLVLGHEVSGVIADSASGTLKKGQRVLVPPVFPCGRCRMCLTGRSTICERGLMIGNHRDGGFAEYIAVPHDMALWLPDTVPLEEGCIISDAIATPYHAIFNRGRVHPGDQLVIWGTGGVGLSAVALAAAAGAHVTAVDVVPQKLERARELGAEHTVNAGDADAAKEIRKLTGGGADVALECIGNPATIRAACDIVRPGGRLVIIGFTDKDVTLPAGRIMFRELEIVGSLGCGVQDYSRVFRFLSGGALDLKRLVTHRFPLERIREGFDLLEKGDPALIRGIVVPEPAGRSG